MSKIFFITLIVFFTGSLESVIGSHQRGITEFLQPKKVILISSSLTGNAPKGTNDSSVVRENPTALKRSLPERGSVKKTKLEPEMQVGFLRGTDEHIEAYSNYIDEAEEAIILASWNLNYIPQMIFNSLMDAKRRGIYISFIVNSVKRPATLRYFESHQDEETTFSLFETKSHAKFLMIDKKSLVLGSYNALGDSFEETEDASITIGGTIPQLWPFYMSLYETYTSIEEYPTGIFDGIALISKARNPGERQLLQRTFKDGSKIFLLRTIKEHEDFFKLAPARNGDITIYSPFSTKDNTLKRLRTLGSVLAPGTKAHLKVLERFERGLRRLVSEVPNLASHTTIEVATSHQKVVVIGKETLCVGSLNWLSAAQDAKDLYSNVELSIVLQGEKAREIIERYYNN